MDDGGPTASIIFYVAMLLIDMFFYGFGAALDSLNEKEIERRAEEDIEGHSRDRKSIRRICRHIRWRICRPVIPIVCSMP